MADLTGTDLQQLFAWAEELIATIDSIDTSLKIMSGRMSLDDL